MLYMPECRCPFLYALSCWLNYGYISPTLISVRFPALQGLDSSSKCLHVCNLSWEKRTCRTNTGAITQKNANNKEPPTTLPPHTHFDYIIYTNNYHRPNKQFLPLFNSA